MSDHSFPSPNPFQPPEGKPASPKRSIVWWLLGGVLLTFFCCGGLCLIPIGRAVYRAATERDDVEQVITAFLTDLEAKRFEACLAYFSARSIRVASLSKEGMEQLAENPAFRGAQVAHVTNINVTYAFNSNSDEPQGTIANVTGTVTYADGATGSLQATLEQEKKIWRLHKLNLNRPTDPPTPQTEN